MRRALDLRAGIFLPRYGQPDVDMLARNLSTAIHRRPATHRRESALDIRNGDQHLHSCCAGSCFLVLEMPTVPHALGAFIQRSLYGHVCPECEGTRARSPRSISMRWWIRASPSKKASVRSSNCSFVSGYNRHTFVKSGFYRRQKPLKKYTKEEWHDFLHRDDIEGKTG